MFHEFLEAVSEDVKGERDKNKVKEFFSQHKSGKASVVNDCQEKTFERSLWKPSTTKTLTK